MFFLNFASQNIGIFFFELVSNKLFIVQPWMHWALLFLLHKLHPVITTNPMEKQNKNASNQGLSKIDFQVIAIKVV